jgi:NAD(P)-dependent dehydrogenase (short-subunit alcohol dehydrogenase family)
MKENKQKTSRQTQNKQPGVREQMKNKPKTRPVADNQRQNRFRGKVVLITGGDSGIGRACALAFAKEGASLVINYLEEHTDANDTKKEIEKLGGRALLIPGDISIPETSNTVVEKTLKEFKKIDILINNAAKQFPQEKFEDVSDKQLEETFQTNILSFFYLSKKVVPHMEKGGSIINTASVVAYRGSKHLIDYAATKGAIISFTRSLALSLVERGIRVNAVAPGAVWTPLIPASFKKKKVESFGTQNPMQRAGEPNEVAGCYTFLASKEASFITGQTIHPNGGEIING